MSRFALQFQRIQLTVVLLLLQMWLLLALPAAVVNPLPLALTPVS
jgi:hypothetical protein